MDRPAWIVMLVTVTLNMAYVLVVTTLSVPIKRVLSCPDCGGNLVCLRLTNGDGVSNGDKPSRAELNSSQRLISSQRFRFLNRGLYVG